MSISKINFTASLLNNSGIQAQQQTKPAETQAVTEPEQPVEVEQENDTATNPIEAEEPESHTLRNWSIGLGAAAVLIGLGVAGRKGHLGEGFQRLLRGSKNEVEHAASDAAEHSKPRVTVREDEISAEEFEQIVNRDSETVIGGGKDNVVVDEEPLIIRKPKAEETPAPKAEETPASRVELTPKQAELNAKLDRVPPHVDEIWMHHEFPSQEALYKQLGIDMKEIEKIDISKYSEYTSSRIGYNMELPDGRHLFIIRNKDGLKEIDSILAYDKNDNHIGSVNIYADKTKSYYGDVNIHTKHDSGNVGHVIYKYRNGGVKSEVECSKTTTGNTYYYDAKGNLESIKEPTNTATGIYRRITFDDGRPIDISYSDAKTYTWLKSDFFDENGKIIRELYNLVNLA